MPSKAITTLRLMSIKSLLQNYLDKMLVDTLVGITEHGAKIGYEGPSTKTISSNHRSCFENTSVIDQSIAKELSHGRIKLLPSLPDKYFCSLLGLVPKLADGMQTGWRTIFDLSNPEGHSVNDGIPKEYGTISYEILQDAIQLVKRYGRGCTLMKRDLKSAFRHIPVSPQDYWLLIFEWEGNYYVDLCLPFGLRTAPRIFNLFSEAIHWVLEALYGWSITHYLDDFLAVFPTGTEIPLHSTIFDDVLGTLGF
jgi:hypothetical protein